ncbi:histidine triad protein D [Streptococcus pneumoniae]|nr:histidine triad protein D [Streptococcus pneumoniae]
MKINKKYLAGSVAVLALSVCSYELGRYQAGQDKKESNRVAYIDGDQAGQKAEKLIEIDLKTILLTIQMLI